MRYLELAIHFLSGEGLVYVGASAMVSVILHGILRSYLRACVWSVVTCLALMVGLIRGSSAPFDTTSLVILGMVFIPAYLAIALVVGVPFRMLRARSGAHPPT